MRARASNTPEKSPSAYASRRRRGVILLAVLVALVLLTLAGYQYADLMQAEYRAADNTHRAMQARVLAESGIHYAAALLASPDNVNNMLGGNITNNPQYFMDIQVPTGDGSGMFGKFSLIAPPDPSSQAANEPAFGVIDEGAKINLNVLMQLDPSGQTLYNALMMLPNMTSDVAYSIVDWLDADGDVSPGGAEDDYYTGLSPPYHAKNGPLESLEELLLVKGVTPALLFGADLNRNGFIDANEDSSSGTGLGWSAFLTVYSREQNSDTSGTAYTYLNASDLQSLYETLQTQIDPGLATFIILYRQYGGSNGGGGGNNAGNSNGGNNGANNMGGNNNSSKGSNSKSSGGNNSSNKSSGGNNTGAGNNSGNASQNTSQTNGNLGSVTLDFTQQGNNKIKSMWELINATVTVPGSGNNQPAVTYTSPLSDQGSQASMLPQLFTTCTLSSGNEIPARININTAPQEVLSALQGILNPSLVSSGTASSSSGTSSTSGSNTSGSNTSGSGTATVLQDTDIQTILSTRPSASAGEAPDPVFETPAWLLLKANLSVSALQKLDPYITTRSQVYRAQSIGYFDQGGPAVRVEAVIDVNGGRPRIMMWRDLTVLGKGWDRQQ